MALQDVARHELARFGRRSDVDLAPAELSFHVSILGARHIKRRGSPVRAKWARHAHAEPGHRDADPRLPFIKFISSTEIGLAGAATMPLSALMRRLAGMSS